MPNSIEDSDIEVIKYVACVSVPSTCNDPSTNSPSPTPKAFAAKGTSTAKTSGAKPITAKGTSTAKMSRAKPITAIQGKIKANAKAGEDEGDDSSQPENDVEK